MEFGGGTLEGDPYAGYLVEDSDLEYSETCSDDGSSEDDDGMVNMIPAQGKKQCLSKSVQEVDNSSVDEFEREMDKEADELLKIVMKANNGENKHGLKKSLDPVSTTSQAKPVEGETVDDDGDDDDDDNGDKFYNEIYFDSSDEGEEEDGTSKRKKAKKKIVKLTNDELFYDPKMDEEDEKWVEHQRQNYHKTDSSSQNVKAVPEATGHTSTPSKSDAILNCPACMTTLCLDCQSHELYSNQFRAMFALNCKIIKDEVLRYCPKQTKRKRKLTQPEHNQELYRPVRCTICDTEVAVYDKDEVFHFFNVIASAS